MAKELRFLASAWSSACPEDCARHEAPSPNSSESGGAFFSEGSFTFTRSRLTATWMSKFKILLSSCVIYRKTSEMNSWNCSKIIGDLFGVLNAGCGHKVGMPTSKVKNAGATTMDGGGFAAEGDLTLGGSFRSLWSRHIQTYPTQLGPFTGSYHDMAVSIHGGIQKWLVSFIHEKIDDDLGVPLRLRKPALIRSIYWSPSYLPV